MDYSTIVDQLADIKAQIADLEKIEADLRAQIVASGERSIDGVYHRVTVSVSERDKIDWKAIAEKFSPSRQLITAHTSTSVVTTVRVSGRVKGAA